ncbi:acetate kinase [soil metagenome]
MPKQVILAVNAGSSSLKIGVFDRETFARESGGAVDWRSEPVATSDHASALEQLLGDLDLSTVAAVGHRVVQGGTRFREAVQIDDSVTSAIDELAVLAPLHNRAALDGIAAIGRLLPEVPQVAAFDTAFHATLPPVAYHYAVPWQWYEQWGIRRLGFHGLSHAYCASRVDELLDHPRELRLVSCHLGQGCSVTAILNGESVATTMGFTPMDGLMMGTRSGAIDPGIVTHLIERRGLTAAQIESALNHDSGLLGVSGVSGDMREILAARSRGNHRAALAFDLFIASLRDAILTMAAAMDGIDALLFTGGIGEHSAEVRSGVCSQLGWIGVEIDDRSTDDEFPDCEISTDSSRVQIFIIRTQEELMVARETRRVLGL